MQQAGVSNLAFDLNYANIGFSSEYQDWAQIYQQDLAKIGVTASIKPQEGSAFTAQGLARSYNGMRLSAGAFANFPEASTTFTFLGLVQNSAGWTSPEWVDTVTSASVEPDAAKRKAIYAKLNDMWLEESAFMPVSYYPSMAITKASVKGLRYQFNPVMTYMDMWLDR